MKKFNLIILALITFFLTGCGNINLDLNKVSENLDNLTTDDFDLLTAVENIEIYNNYFADLVNIYDYDLEKLEITAENIENMAFRVDSNNNPAYIIIKPKEGKKEELKNEIADYLSKFTNLTNKLESEYEEHLIYIFSDKSEEILKKIKNSKTPVFSMLFNVENSELETLTGINPADLDEFLVKNSVMTQANSYYILKPKEGKTEAVKTKMNEYMSKLEQQWKTYLPEQYELVKDRLEETYGDYLIYVISNNNELVLKTIKDSKK